MTSIVKTSCSGCCICTLPCLYYWPRQSLAAHASSSGQGGSVEIKTKVEALQEFYRALQAWSFWVIIAATVYHIAVKTRLAPVPQHLRLPVLLILPIVEISKSSVTYYSKSALHSRAWMKQFTRRFCSLAVVVVMFWCICFCF